MTIAQTRLDLFGDEPGEDAPQVYVATPLTHVAADLDARRTIDAEVGAIARAIDEATRQAEQPWPVTVHAPIHWTAPWNTADDRDPVSLYQANRRHLVHDTDALVVLGYRGGSMGAGQEFDWAQRAGIPILYLHHHEEPVSRQVAGAPATLTVASHRSIEELSDHVRSFLRVHRARIEGGPRRRRDRHLRFQAVQSELHALWVALPNTEQRLAAGIVGVAPAQVAAALGHPLELASTPLAVATSIGAVLGADVASLISSRTLADLTPGQMRALIAASEEQTWDDEAIGRLASRGRLEIAREGVRRFRLDTPDDWLRLHRSV